MGLPLGVKRGVGVRQAGDQFSQCRAELMFVASHQDGVFQRVLAGSLYFYQIFAHHLVLLETGYDFSAGSVPDDVWEVFAHILGRVTPC